MSLSRTDDMEKTFMSESVHKDIDSCAIRAQCSILNDCIILIHQAKFHIFLLHVRSIRSTRVNSSEELTDL